MHQSKNNPHVLQEISTNILTKMSDITGSPHWACSEKCKQKKLVTENSVSTVCYCCVLRTYMYWSIQYERLPEMAIFLDYLCGAYSPSKHIPYLKWSYVTLVIRKLEWNVGMFFFYVSYRYISIWSLLNDHFFIEQENNNGIINFREKLDQKHNVEESRQIYAPANMQSLFRWLQREHR